MKLSQLSTPKTNLKWPHSPTEGSDLPGEADPDPEQAVSPVEVTEEEVEEESEEDEEEQVKPPEAQDTPQIHPNNAVNAIIDTVRKPGTVLLLLPVHG